MLTDQKKYDSIFGKGKLGVRGVVHRHTHVPSKRAENLAAPRISSDSMNAIRSMADGEMYDSKSKYHKSLTDNGCHVIEAGMQTTPVDMSESITARDVKQAVQKTAAQLGATVPL